MIFFTKRKQKKIELLARPGCRRESRSPSKSKASSERWPATREKQKLKSSPYWLCSETPFSVYWMSNKGLESFLKNHRNAILIAFVNLKSGLIEKNCVSQFWTLVSYCSIAGFYFFFGGGDTSKKLKADPYKTPSNMLI